MFESPASTTARPLISLDPWSAEYGSAFDLEEEESEDAPAFEVDPLVETADWAHGIAPRAIPFPDLVAFVDGVQRVESWARVDDGESSSVAVLASVAAGCVLSTPGRATVSVDYVSRVIAIGGTTRAEPLVVESRGGPLVFEVLPATGSGRHGAMQAAAVRRRDFELASIQKHLAVAPLVIADGRLVDLTRGPNQVAGIAKTLHQLYLAAEQRALVSRLGPGERTPVFTIKDAWGSRHSWFLRLPHTRAIHHSYAGIVRIEIPVDESCSPVEVADMLSYNLPRFASRPEHDPRAPQNLLPVGALEKRLRHELGEQAFIRRAIEDQLSRGFGA